MLPQTEECCSVCEKKASAAITYVAEVVFLGIYVAEVVFLGIGSVVALVTTMPPRFSRVPYIPTTGIATAIEIMRFIRHPSGTSLNRGVSVDPVRVSLLGDGLADLDLRPPSLK
jgi:hypothetical protein